MKPKSIFVRILVYHSNSFVPAFSFKRISSAESLDSDLVKFRAEARFMASKRLISCPVIVFEPIKK